MLVIKFNRKTSGGARPQYIILKYTNSRLVLSNFMQRVFSVSKTQTINPPEIMGKSPGIRKLFDQLGKIAGKDVPVLISGERGTCKDLVARLIHDNSLRQRGPFVGIDVTVFPMEMAESRLPATPDAAKKAASDGMEQVIGRFSEADGGTLFVGEIFRADARLMNKMTRLFRDREMKFNSYAAVRSDARIVAATSNPAHEYKRKGQSLYELYRVFHGGHLRIPALRERKEDILPLAEYCMEESSRKFDLGRKELSKDAKAYLLKYEWPGNMRELQVTIGRAMILCRGSVLDKRDLVMADIDACSIRDFLEEKLKRFLKEMTKLETCNLYHTVLSEAERSLVAIVLKETGGNQLKAAKTLGINRNTLRSKIKEYKLRA
jgi:DNA-binding NtrC family response regulator